MMGKFTHLIDKIVAIQSVIFSYDLKGSMMFEALKGWFFSDKHDYTHLTNQEKKEYVIRNLKTYSSFELKSLLKSLKKYIGSLDPNREDFDAHLDKLLFGHALLARCLEQRKYGFPVYPLTLSDLQKEIGGYDDQIERILRVGELILSDKALPLCRELVSLHIIDSDLADYFVHRLEQYETFAFDDYIPVFVHKQLSKLAPAPVEELFSTIDINQDNFDYLMIGLITWRQSISKQYPISIDRLYQLVDLKEPITRDDYEQLFLKIGQIIFDEKLIPIPNLKKIYGAPYLTFFIAQRVASCDYLDLNDYHAKQIIRELQESLPHPNTDNFDDLNVDDEQYDFILSGFVIYALVVNNKYPISLERLYHMTELDTDVNGRDLFLAIGKLALEKKVIPIDSFYPQQELDERLSVVSHFSTDFFNSRVSQHSTLSFTEYKPYQELIDLLPSEAKGVFDGFRFKTKDPEPAQVVCGALITQLVAHDDYPLSLNDLTTLCSVRTLHTTQDYRHFYQHIGALAFKNQIPFNEFNTHVKGLSKQSYKQVIENFPSDLLSILMYLRAKSLYTQFNFHGRREPYLLPYLNKDYQNYKNYVLGLTIYLLAQKGRYPISCEQLSELCAPKSNYNSFYSFFSSSHNIDSPKTSEEYDHMFLAIGTLALVEKSIPFEMSTVEKHALNLSDETFNFLNRLSIGNPYLDEQLLSYEEYQQKRSLNKIPYH